MEIREHCKNCIYCLEYVKAGIGSRFESDTYLNENIWVDIYAKEN